MKGTRLRTVAAILVGMLASVAGAAPAGASPSTRTGLAGEVLEIGTAWSPSMVSPEAVEACEGLGIAFVDFRVEGSAAGPYPGTFVETGTVMIGPRTRVTTNSVGVEIGAGRVLGIHAIFHIQSGGTSIDGETWLIAPSGLLAGCDTFVDAPSPLNVGWRFTGFTLQFEGPLVRSRATITTPQGAWINRGTASVSLAAEHEVTTACPTSCSSESSAAGFEELFI